VTVGLSPEKSSKRPDAAGLCHDCAHARVIRSAKGSEFLLCRLSERDPNFPKYPRLPVLSCAGYKPKTRIR
jgi:hypothetical protein